MRIGEFANRCGVTVRAVRYYESLGLLVPRRASNGYRVFDESDVARVRNIRALMSTGLDVASIASVGHCLDDESMSSPCSAAIDLYEERLSVIEERVQELTAVRDELCRKVTELRREAHQSTP